MRQGSAGLFDFVVFSRTWAGALSVTVASNYDANWREISHSRLGCSIDLADLRLGKACYYSPQTRYRYGKSDADLQRQVQIVAEHLLQYAPPFFVAAKNYMLSRKTVQFGLREIAGRSLTEAEKLALRKELGRAYSNVGQRVTNARFVELHDKLVRFTQQPDIPQEERDQVCNLTSELLLANISPEVGR